MKLGATALILLAVTIYSSEARTCWTGDTTTVTDDPCSDTTETICHYPVFEEYTGYKDDTQDFGCGACVPQKKTDGECQECTTDSCNIKDSVTEYTCFKYTWDGTNAYFKGDSSATKETCYTTADKTCNHPTLFDTAVTQTVYTNTSPCGVCAANKDAGCKECNGDNCNKPETSCYLTTGTADTACTDTTLTYCKGPTFTDYDGYSAQQYECGQCANTDSDCEHCDTLSEGENCKSPTTPTVETDTFMCHAYSWDATTTKFTKNADKSTCTKKTTSPISCTMPGRNATESAHYTSVTGCGTCSVADKDARHCEDCTTDSCNEQQPIKCFQATTLAENTVATDCTDIATNKCSMPKFIEYSGLAAGQDYACGACDSDTSETCEDCDGSSGSGCNKAVAGEAFNCYDYTASAAAIAEKWAEDKCDDDENADATKCASHIAAIQQSDLSCKRMEGTDAECNHPIANGDAAKWSALITSAGQSTCGPCPVEETAIKVCKTCTGASCNNITEWRTEKEDDSGAFRAATTFILLVSFLWIIL